jgi:hypothetical protein
MATPDYVPNSLAEASADKVDEKSEKEARYWLEQISAALKREKAWRQDAKKVVSIYEAGTDAQNDYNILYSNTETMAPALYNSTPQPIVKRRFDDPDELGQMASKAGERILKYLSDDGMSEYATFDELMQSAVLEALVPGRGTTKFRYEAKISKVEPEGKGDDDGDPNAQEAASEKVDAETVCGEEVPWDRFLHGYGRKWKDVPWVAFYETMTKDELIDNFPECGAQVPVSSGKPESADTDTDAGEESQPGMGVVEVAGVWSIWDKASRTVIFVAESYPVSTLKVVPDPLGLTGFFPCPKPLTFFQKISSLVPIPLYKMYEKQAKELNRVSQRISKILEAMKVRGMYDGSAEGLDKVLAADDNELVPAQNVAALMGTPGGLEKAIWLFPIKDLVPVLQQLYLQRSQIKQVIFEITGIADIMRGSTQASETLGAQELKNQWGTLRLKRAQKSVARYARDCLRIMEEIAVSKLSEQTLAAMTGLPFPDEGQKAQAQQVIQQVQSSTPPGQPPQIPDGLQEVLALPTWKDILGLLRNDVQRSYRVDIENNSTVDAEATQDKQDITELLTAISQFMSGVAPLIESGTMPFDVAKSMLLVITRRFRFGTEIEDMLKKMQAPPPKPDPTMQKVQADMQVKQMEAKQKQDAHQADMQAKQLDLQTKQQLAAMDMEQKRQEHALKLQELRQKAAVSERQHQMKMQQTAAQTHATVVSAHAQVEVARETAKHAHEAPAKSEN